MKCKTLLCSACALLAFATSVAAQDFGLEDKSLADQFYEEALEIVEQNLTPEQKLFYGIQNSGEGGTSNDAGFGVLRDAYRTDPDATLALIRRILEAGNPQ